MSAEFEQDEWKHWSESGTMRKALIALITSSIPALGLLLSLFGINLAPEHQTILIAFIIQVISMIFIIGAMRSRVKANTKIKPVMGVSPEGPGSHQGGSIRKEGFIWLAIIAVLAVICVSIISKASAADMKIANFTIEKPTKRVDGTPLPADQIKHYVLTFKHSDGTNSTLITTSTSGTWEPPKVGEYSVTGQTVDTEGLVSEPSIPTTYTAVTIDPPVINPPMPPTLMITLSLPIDGNGTVHQMTNGTVTIGALDFLDTTPTGPEGWYATEVNEIPVMKAPDVAWDRVNYAGNARVDYLINVPAGQGGTYKLSMTGYAPNSNSDSLFVGQNGAPSAFNKGEALVFNPWNKWVTTPYTDIELLEGQSVISVFMREPNMAYRTIDIVKK